LQYVSRANLNYLPHNSNLDRTEPPAGFASFRHAPDRMTIFYPEVKMKLDQNERT
jgi:hypothetical protein